MRRWTGDRAVVLGGSMAGLLAARVLADSYGEVTVVDRDELAPGSAPRRGVPQGRHLHALLAGGQLALERLFPGLTAELAAHGAPVGDPLADARLVFSGHRLARADSGLVAVSASRWLLEDRVRARVRELPGVRFVPPADVVGLRSSADHRRITGAWLLRRGDGGTPEVIDADLVIDATGRRSRTPDWLENLGFERPGEERVRVDVGYATRRYRLPADALDGDQACVYGPLPDLPRGAVLARVEDGGWTLTLSGLVGDHPPTDPAGFDAFARTLSAPDLHDAVRSGEPIDDPVPFRFAANVRRHYERTRHLPEGFVVIGDAMCSFNPIYGQGMSVAALQAIALSRCLENGHRPLARTFIRAAANVADHAWKMATSADLAIPGVEGPRPGAVRLANAWTSRILSAAGHDPDVAIAFMRVAGMVDPLSRLVRPLLATRVLFGEKRCRSEIASGRDLRHIRHESHPDRRVARIPPRRPPPSWRAL
jgi:2-polyprenyl-6-methoxyphenol hydroxylase-like FAD-dependent oxidoreductase